MPAPTSNVDNPDPSFKSSNIWDMREGWLDELIGMLDGNRGLMRDLLDELLPGARYVPPEAGYLAWVDCRGLRLGEDPARAFLDRGRVAVRAGADFGTAGEGFVRVTMGTSDAILREIVQRMCAAVH